MLPDTRRLSMHTRVKPALCVEAETRRDASQKAG